MHAVFHHRGRVLGALLMALSPCATAAAQQSAMAELPEEPPTIVQYYLGPFLVNPNISVPEFGVDSNVFNESASPREDYVVKVRPDINFFADLGIFRVAAQSGATFNYYHRYKDERSIGQNVRGRVAARMGRLRPWLGGANVVTNDRMDPEIDARVERTDTELAAGAQFEISPLATVGVSANRIGIGYGEDEIFRGTSLAPELDRRTEAITASLRLRATPFTTLTFNGYTARDRFDLARSRDSRSRGGEVEVSFSPEAIIRGKVSVAYRDFRPEDPLLDAYRGVTGRGGISAIIAGRGILGVTYARDVRYSYERTDGYYIETGGDVMYTHQLVGPLDAQVRVGRQNLNFTAMPQDGERREVLRTYHVGVGYALENRSRIGLTYEHAERHGDTSSDRPFSRRRVFGSFSYEFWR